MTRRTNNSQPVSLTDTPDITPGTWVFEPGDSGDDSVGLQGYPPTVGVEIPGRDGDFVTLAVIQDPIYHACLEEVKNSGQDYECDSGDRYLLGSPNQNGLLMAGSKGLLEACQTILQELREESTYSFESPSFNSNRSVRIQSQIELLESAIKQAIIFPEDS